MKSSFSLLLRWERAIFHHLTEELEQSLVCFLVVGLLPATTGTPFFFNL